MSEPAEDRLLALGVVVVASILFYGLVVEQLLLALCVVLLLVVIRALYKILGVLYRIEDGVSAER